MLKNQTNPLYFKLSTRTDLAIQPYKPNTMSTDWRQQNSQFSATMHHQGMDVSRLTYNFYKQYYLSFVFRTIARKIKPKQSYRSRFDIHTETCLLVLLLRLICCFYTHFVHIDECKKRSIYRCNNK